MSLNPQQFEHPDVIKRVGNVTHVDFDPDRNVPLCGTCNGYGRLTESVTPHPIHPSASIRKTKRCPTCGGDG